MPLNEGRNDPGGSLAEVYDDPEPSAWIQILAIEPLTLGYGILLSMIWMGDDAQHHLRFVHQVRTPEREMKARARVEDDDPAVGVDRLRMLQRHTL
jgi:hypothetical protein